jgi:uncharacterized protein
MSEQDNVALAQKLYAAFGRGDIQTILDHLTADVEWRLEGPASLPLAGIRHGRAGVAGFFQELAAHDDPKLTPERFIAQGDFLVMVGRYAATVRATGKKSTSPPRTSSRSGMAW